MLTVAQEHERAAAQLRQIEAAAAEAQRRLRSDTAESDALAHTAARLRAEIADLAAAAERHRADEAAAAKVAARMWPPTVIVHNEKFMPLANT